MSKHESFPTRTRPSQSETLINESKRFCTAARAESGGKANCAIAHRVQGCWVTSLLAGGSLTGCCEPSCVNLVGTVSTLPGRELTHLGIMPPCADSTRSCVREEVYTAAVLQTERREEQQQAGPEHRTLPSRGGAVAVRVAVALRIAWPPPSISRTAHTRPRHATSYSILTCPTHTHTRFLPLRPNLTR